jgi:hypothetical protein
MDAAIAEHPGEIAQSAEVRIGRARDAYLTAVDALEAAVGDLATAQALRSWANDPRSLYKERSGAAVPLVIHSSDPLPVADVIDALRQALEQQPQRPWLPSPFLARAVVEPVPSG